MVYATKQAIIFCQDKSIKNALHIVSYHGGEVQFGDSN